MNSFIYAGVGVASIGKGCAPHNNPENYIRRGADVFCVVCGGWIGKASPYGDDAGRKASRPLAGAKRRGPSTG